MEGRPLVFLDNHNGVLEHDLIAQAVTGDKVLIRKFGVLENIEVETRAVIAATGNGISIGEDLDRRALLIEIDTELAQPHFRKYRKPSPVDLILADRAKYIKAALIAPLAYIAAGCPKVTDKQVLDFEDWERLVRFPLIWLGEGDPLDAMEDASNTDADRRNACAMRVAIKTVCGCGKDKEKYAEDIINAFSDASMKEPSAMAILMAVAGGKKGASAKKLGWWLSKNKDVIDDDGLVIRGRPNSNTKVNMWWVEQIGGSQKATGG